MKKTEEIPNSQTNNKYSVEETKKMWGVKKDKGGGSEPPPTENKKTLTPIEFNDSDILNRHQISNFSRFLITHGMSKEKSQNELFLCLQVASALGCKTVGDLVLAVSNMYFLKGSVHLWGDLPLSIVIKSGELEEIREFFIDKNYKEICLANKNLEEDPIAAICIIKRKGDKPKEFYLTIKDLERSGVCRDGNFVGKAGMETWKLYPKTHWRRRLQRYSLGFVFADILKCCRMSNDDQTETELKKVASTENKTEPAVSKMAEVYAVESKDFPAEGNNQKEEEQKKEEPEAKEESENNDKEDVKNNEQKDFFKG